jgi:hypothetical protein
LTLSPFIKIEDLNHLSTLAVADKLGNEITRGLKAVPSDRDSFPNQHGKAKRIHPIPPRNLVPPTNVAEVGPDIAELIACETQRLSCKLIMIPSESDAADSALQAQGSVFQNIYAEGCPDLRPGRKPHPPDKNRLDLYYHPLMGFDCPSRARSACLP